VRSISLKTASLLALPVVLYLAQAVYLRSFSIDDVGISYRYAAHLAEGYGLVWNIGGPHVEGYSNFLWVILLGIGKWAGSDIETFAKFAGAALGLLNLTLLWAICRRLWYPRAFWWLPVLLVAITPEWIAWSVSGLEIALFGTCLLLMFFGLVVELSQRRWLLSVGGAGLAMVRPEGAVLAVMAILMGWLAARYQGKANRFSDFGIPLAVLIVTGLALVVFRMWYFGYPFPNTVYAKFRGRLLSLPQVLEWSVFILPFVACAIAGLRSVHDRREVWLIRTALALIALQMLMVLPVHPVMYILHRYQVALLPFVVLAVPLLLDRYCNRGMWLGIAGALVLAVWSLQGWPSVQEFHQKNELMMREQRRLTETLLSLPGHPTVAMIDAGRVPYWTDLPGYDVGGLCERRLAHEGFTPEAAIDRRAEVYVISIRPMADGKFFPYLTEDQDVWVAPQFRETYSLWKICRREPEALAANWMYDYAVFLRTDWALEKGFLDLRERDNTNP